MAQCEVREFKIKPQHIYEQINMTNKLQQYLQKKEQKEQLEQELSRIEESESFQEDFKFLKELEELIELHGKSKLEVAELLNPTPTQKAIASFTKPPRKARAERHYKNPHTGEEVKTAGGNHTVLKQWRKDYPEIDLKDWLVSD